jgi:hypothetical protein
MEKVHSQRSLSTATNSVCSNRLTKFSTLSKFDGHSNFSYTQSKETVSFESYLTLGIQDDLFQGLDYTP